MATNRLTPNTQLALEAFLLDAKSRNLSPRTLKFYRDQIGWFFGYLADQRCTDLTDITATSIRSYLVHLQERGLADTSCHAAARAIRAFFNYCVTDEWLPVSPMARVKMPKTGEKIKEPFSPDDIHRLLAAAPDQRCRALLLCLLDSGCRASEFLEWNVSDVNVMTGTVVLRKTKNRKERVVYLGTLARKELLKLYRTQTADPDAPLWRNRNNNERLGIAGLQILLRKLGEAAGVTPCSPHRFRRTFALWSLRNGMNVFSLQKLMGHSDLTVLRRYLAIVESDTREAHQQYGAVDHML